MLVALKLYYRVDDMFQNLRSGKRTFLIYMAYQYYWSARSLGKAQQRCSTLAHLGDAARTAVDVFCSNGLYGVDYYNLRLDFLGIFENSL